MDELEHVHVEDLFSFPLYEASKLVIQAYGPLLEPYDLTYTQYLVMLVLWEKNSISMADLGKRLYLDSGTLTPLVRKLIDKKLVTKKTSRVDHRKTMVNLTLRGKRLEEKMRDLPQKLDFSNPLNERQSHVFKMMLEKIIRTQNK